METVRRDVKPTPRQIEFRFFICSGRETATSPPPLPRPIHIHRLNVKLRRYSIRATDSRYRSSAVVAVQNNVTLLLLLLWLLLPSLRTNVHTGTLRTAVCVCACTHLYGAVPSEPARYEHTRFPNEPAERVRAYYDTVWARIVRRTKATDVCECVSARVCVFALVCAYVYLYHRMNSLFALRDGLFLHLSFTCFLPHRARARPLAHTTSSGSSRITRVLCGTSPRGTRTTPRLAPPPPHVLRLVVK